MPGAMGEGFNQASRSDSEPVHPHLILPTVVCLFVCLFVYLFVCLRRIVF